MKQVCRSISWFGLALMFAAAVLVFRGRLSLHSYRLLAMAGTVAWFATVPGWMHHRLHHSPD
jgi:hypothetical protein